MSALRHELEQVVFHVNVCTQPWQAQLRTKQMETQITTSRQEKEPFTFKNMKDVVSLNNFEAGDLMLFFVNPNNFYEAFNKDAPNYFLAEESLINFPDERFVE